MMVEVLVTQTVKGIKKVTRRTGGLDEVNKDPDSYRLEKLGSSAEFIETTSTGENFIACNHRFKVGEIVYLKEPFCKIGNNNYRHKYLNDNPEGLYKWKNKLYMPEEAARFFIKITSVKCERLYDITEEQAILEGIEPDGVKWKNYTKLKKGKFKALSPIESVMSLFKFANKMAAGTMLPNYWVWVYEYELYNK